MSAATPFAVVGVAIVGAFAVAWLEGVVAGRPSPVPVIRGVGRTLSEPMSAPATYDRWLFHMAPTLLLVAALVALSTVPWTPGFRGIDTEAGVILFAGALAYVTPAVFMAGWGAGGGLAVVGGFRFLGLMLAYAMPLAMVLTAVGAPAESLRPAAIVEVQANVPMAIVQPLALALFVPSVMAVAFIPPFDLPQASSELGGGAFSRYSGLEAGLVALSQRILVVAVAGMTAAVFLGGWHGPLLPAAVWMVLKTAAVAGLMLWAGRRLPRVEIDRLLAFAWKVPIPLSILAIGWAGLVTLLFYR